MAAKCRTYNIWCTTEGVHPKTCAVYWHAFHGDFFNPARFRADREAGFARAAVLADYEAAVNEHGVRAIPTVIVPATGRALVGLAELSLYRSAIEEAAG